MEKDTFVSIIADKNGELRHRKRMFINGELCNSKQDFWNKYVAEIDSKTVRHFGKNLDAFKDAITAQGPGSSGDCIFEIIAPKNWNSYLEKRILLLSLNY